jgi:hypothetical protein
MKLSHGWKLRLFIAMTRLVEQTHYALTARPFQLQNKHFVPQILGIQIASFLIA